MAVTLRMAVVAAGNIHGPTPAIRFLFERGSGPPRPAAAPAGLAGAIAALHALHCVPSLGPAGETPARPPGDMLASIGALAVALQRTGGHDVVAEGPVTGAGQEMRWVACLDPWAGQTAVAIAARLAAELAAAGPDGLPASRLAEAIERFVERDRNLTPSPNRHVIARAAQRLGWPVRPSRADPTLWELGIGAGTRRFYNSMIDPETRLSFLVQDDKRATSRLLAAGGVSVPPQRAARSAEEASEAAAALGWPVVVKPVAEARQAGVSTEIRSPAELDAAIAKAGAFGWPVLVERHVPGRNYRLMVARGELLEVYERQPPQVTGDGVSTIAELVAQENARPHRGAGPRFLYPPIDLARRDAEPRTPYRDAGMTLASVPAEGALVRLSYYGGDGQGGLTLPVSHAHPGYAQVVRRVHALVPLELCGIDLISPDIAAPPGSATYWINEINAHPSLMIHVREGPRGEGPIRMMRILCGDGSGLRVPVVLVLTDGADRSGLATAIGAALAARRGAVAVASRAGFAVGGLAIDGGDCATLEGSERALADRQARAVVLERPLAELMSAGLGIDRADLLVLAPSQGRDAARFRAAARPFATLAGRVLDLAGRAPDPSLAERIAQHLGDRGAGRAGA